MGYCNVASKKEEPSRAGKEKHDVGAITSVEQPRNNEQ
jgi:hypothetical protein